MNTRRTAQQRIGLFCSGPVLGGAERSMLNVACAVDGDTEVVVISTSREVVEAAREWVPRAQTKLIHLPPGRVRSFVHLRRTLGTLSLDLLQVTLPNPFAERPVQLAAASRRLPVITVEQLVLLPRRRRGAWLKKVIALASAAVVAVGEASRETLIGSFGLRPARTFVIHNGVPADVGSEPFSFADRPVIGSVGRLETQKGIERLIYALAEIPQARLVLVGDGSQRGELTQLAVELGVGERVEFWGWSERARDLIAGFDVFALASRDEAFPLTIVEAMLERTPVVATAVGSVAEAVIDHSTGLIVDSGDHTALVAALNEALRADDARDRRVDAARALAEENFTSEAMALRYEQLWSMVLNRRADSGPRPVAWLRRISRRR